MTVTTQNLTCIRCPRGCGLTVELDGGEVLSVTGNACKRGEIYAKAEVTNPVRTVTSVVPVQGSDIAHMVSVKTKGEVPKAKVMQVVEALEGVSLTAPVEIGDVILANVCDTGIDVVATRRA